MKDDDTLESVAHHYRVPLTQLLMHNFGTTHPAQINWYLRNYVGCTLATRDGKNWRFSHKAQPGLIYIPERKQPVPVEHRPGCKSEAVPLSRPAASRVYSREMPFDTAIKEPFDFPEKGKPAYSGGLLIYRVKVELEGGLYAGGKHPENVIISKDSLKASIEKDLGEGIKVKLAADFKNKDGGVIGTIAGIVKSGGSLAEVAKLLSVSVKKAFPSLSGDSIEPEVGLSASDTFLSLAVSAVWNKDLTIGGALYHGKFKLKIALNVGLSAQGWREVEKKVGGEALTKFLSGGKDWAQFTWRWLAAEGILDAAILAGGAIAATALLTGLMAWAVTHSKQTGVRNMQDLSLL
ncbi:MAG: hypothetical protein JNK87_11750, partial [Bryobacterales bacterium]|nr:hypothetical protein [Bryobacterales bacterium]